MTPIPGYGAATSASLWRAFDESRMVGRFHADSAACLGLWASAVILWAIDYR